jgi:hypothetical protein
VDGPPHFSFSATVLVWDTARFICHIWSSGSSQSHQAQAKVIRLKPKSSGSSQSHQVQAKTRLERAAAYAA